MGCCVHALIERSLMANYGYVTTRKTLNINTLFEAVSKIIYDRFRDSIKVSLCNKTISVDIYREIDRTLRLESKHKIAIRHNGGDDFVWWVDCVVTNDLALMFNGKISDDGIGDKWVGEADYCPRFVDFVKRFHPNNSKFYKYVVYSQYVYCKSVAKILNPKLLKYFGFIRKPSRYDEFVAANNLADDSF